MRGEGPVAHNGRVSRKPTLSPTKLTTYLACPVKYRWTYVDDRGRWYLRAKSYYSFGTTLHRAIERFHAAGGVGLETSEQLAALYDESWIDAGFRSADEMAEAYGDGKEILERYVAKQRSHPQKARALYTERLFKLDLGMFRLVGRVDRVDEHEDGTLEIVDYKSGRSCIDPEQVVSDLAMACYQLLVKSEFPDRPVTATLCALRSGESASWSMPEDEYDTLREDLRVLGEEILNRDYFEIVPTAKPLCSTCDFLPLCRKHEEFQQ
jgi:putative RecB family exonuclease